MCQHFRLKKNLYSCFIHFYSILFYNISHLLCAGVLVCVYICVGRSEGFSSNAPDTGCWLIPHTKRSRVPSCSLVSITTASESVGQNGNWQRSEGAESWLSSLGLRARISLFALVWAGRERAREQWYVVGVKGRGDMMYEARSGGNHNVVERKWDRVSQLAVL